MNADVTLLACMESKTEFALLFSCTALKFPKDELWRLENCDTMMLHPNQDYFSQSRRDTRTERKIYFELRRCPIFVGNYPDLRIPG